MVKDKTIDFLQQMRYHQQCLNRCLLRLENNLGCRNLLLEVNNHANHIKNVPIIGFSERFAVTQEIDSLVDSIGATEESAAHEMVEGLFRCTDVMEQLLEEVSSAQIVLVLLVKARENICSIPLSSIKKVIAITNNNTKKSRIGVCDEVSVEWLSDILGVYDFCRTESNQRFMVLLYDDSVSKGIIVDAIVGVEELIIKPLETMNYSSNGIAGVVQIENGQSVFVINTEALLRQ